MPKSKSRNNESSSRAAPSLQPRSGGSRPPTQQSDRQSQPATGRAPGGRGRGGTSGDRLGSQPNQSVRDMIERLDQRVDRVHSSPSKKRRVSRHSTSSCASDISTQDTSAAVTNTAEARLPITRDDLRLIVREELSAFKSEISRKIEDAVQSALAGVNARISELEAHVNVRDEELNQVHTLAKECKRHLLDMEKFVDDMAAEGRLPTLVISGGAVPPPPPVERAENRRPVPEDTTALAIEVLKKSLPDVAIKKEDIISSFRVQKSRKLVVKFAACGPYTVRDRVYQGRFSLMGEKDKDRKLFISEALTPFRQDMFQALLAAKKAKRIYSVFTRDGSVFFKPTEHERSVWVRNWGVIREYTDGY